jgi:hypothetical protein
MTTIKGDQTVKKNLYVDLTMQAEQVTSTDDMTMAGYFLNTMASDDTIGMYLDQNTNNYTGSSTNKSLSILKTISGSTGTSFSTFGIELGVTDDKDFTADTGSRVVYGQNIGLSVTGDRSSGVTDFIEDIIGLSASVIKSGTNQASGLATDNLSGINASATLSTTNNNAATNFYQTVYGVNAGATIENASMTGSSASLSVYGVSSSVVGLSSSGWDTKKLYGYYFSQFLMGMTATEKWAFYNSSSWNNHLGNDNSKTYWGTGDDCNILYNGTNMVINPKEVGTGVLVFDGATNYGADAGGTDAYAITITGISAYTTGMTIVFKANTANTGAASLNINGLGAITIVKRLNTALANNDILAGMTCMVVYDGTNFIIMNPVVN